MEKLINWLTPVAMAAPLILILNTKISKGSRKIFKIEPLSIPNMDNFALPSERSILFRMKEPAIKGEAIKIYLA